MATTSPCTPTKTSIPDSGAARWRWLTLGIGAALVLATGVVQGLWSDRWTDSSAASLHLAERIQRIPLEFGEWQGEDISTSPREIRAAGAVGHLSRVYRHKQSGEQVSLFLVCGHMRHVSVHTPDRCYPANGFEQQGDPQHFTLATSAGPVETFTTTFRQEDATGVHRQRVFWTWGYEDRWRAPDNPRVTFGGVRALYKMYLISAVPASARQSPEESPAIRFAQDAMGDIDAILFAPQE